MSRSFVTSGLHVYCVVPEEAMPPAGLEGLAARPVRSWAAGGLRAWASALDRPLEPEAGLLRRHHDVVLAAFRAGGVLPVRFGQWLPDPPALTAWLEREAGRMRPVLERLAGAAEFGVRFVAPPGEGPADPGPERPADAPRRAAEGAGSGEAAAGAASQEGPGKRRDITGGAAAAERVEARRYLRTLARRRAAKREALARRDALARGLAEAVGPLILDERLLAAGPGDLAAVAHLVDRARVEPYREAVVRFLERQAPSGAELTGPWPPWSFVG